MTETKTKQVNVNFENDPDLLDALDKMVQTDESDRSKFIRKLIRQELGRRQQLPLPTPTTDKSRKASNRTASLAA